jgi:hypothetical protein
MAEVTSGPLTVIVLNEDETDALVDLLYMHLPEHADDTVLDELVNSMIGRQPAQPAQPAQRDPLKDPLSKPRRDWLPDPLSNWKYSGGDWVLDEGEDNG